MKSGVNRREASQLNSLRRETVLDTAAAALRLADQLMAEGAPSSPPHGDPVWDESDRSAFMEYAEFTTCWELLRLTDAALLPEADRRQRDVCLFEASLPFTTAERMWLLDLYGDRTQPGDFGADLLSSEGTSIEAARRIKIDGRDLAARWSSWRRAADGFIAEEGVLLSRAVLRSIAGDLVPPQS